MRARSFALAAIALVLMWPGERLEATPVLEDPLQGLALNGFGIDFHEDVLGAYDSTLDELRISSLREQAEYRGPLGVLHTFTSFFELTAGVDEFGRVTDRGTVRWEGDFGSGRELLATGKLLDLGFDTAGFSLMRLLLDIEFLDARVSGLGGHVASSSSVSGRQS
jgi:hypothetical protein